MRASILVPTHNRPDTLELAVGSALAQTIGDLEVIIIGDGVTPESRAMAERLERRDPRVVFLDLPKGEHHGEVHRDAAIRSARSDAIFYLCDDDLLMPEHVSDLLELLDDGRTFVQSLNGWIDVDGAVHRYAGSLGSEDAIAGVIDTRWKHNFISLTGTAHSRGFYLELDRPWTTTPVDEWPDRHQWRKMLNQPGFSGATSVRMTALQFPATEPSRAEVTPAEQLDELRRWSGFSREPGAQQRLDRLVVAATEVEFGRVTREFIATSVRLHETSLELEEALRWRRRLSSSPLGRVTRPLRGIRKKR